ncbi:SMP-30/gluconolactonase/LRE family protein [Marinilongibacter aquaticus]|uniref:SMP-30/gluconolactonase/LRE family protein n=1 Tax=Marinilongibacter aquaticus TaxID=2975157 RepID=UPI0021BDA6F1|nr:SMP-30/gluconolactonase/LRE family protein [Marinilongibacter aquaticus]UBM58913.1 SMP-30/gluconolactonase/LRE family protein [Marinilongibacter aquaticus]
MRNFLNVLLLLGIFIALNIAYLLVQSGFFLDIKPHFDGTGEVLNSPPGIEDLTVDQSNGDVYLSSTDRRNGSGGGIFKANLQDEELVFQNLTASLRDENFKPHGLSLLKKYRKTYLFVISHPSTEVSVVDRFEIENDSLVSKRRFAHPLMISPNDICAVDTATFYFTNDHGTGKGLKRTLSDFLLLKSGFVALYNNGEARKVSQNMAYANGINLSPDGKFLYVTATTEKKIFVFEKAQSHALKLKDVHLAHTGVDNIEIDADGNLLIGCHPQMLKFLGHAKSAANRSPSQIIKVVYLPETDYKFLQEELYLNNGDPLSASSVGAFFSNKNGENNLLVGSVFESKILRLHRNL